MKALQKYQIKAQNKRLVWQKSEINNVRKQIHNAWSKQGEQRDAASNLIETLNVGGFKITDEQSQFGLDYLRSKIFNSKGEVRNSEFARCFGSAEIKTLKNFKKFTFEGLRVDYGNGHWINTTPIYRVHAKDGSYFDYTMAHWSLPEVVFTYRKAA